MATLVMIYGQSGTGKSTSLRNFKAEDVAVVSVSGKPLPFRTDLKTFKTNDYRRIKEALSKTDRKSIVIDDATYLMADKVLSQADVGGYAKWTILAKEFADFLLFCQNLPDDKIVYIIGHTDIDGNGREHFKSYGKMLDDALCTVEARFVIVLKSLALDGKYYFETHNNGSNTVKSPLGLFEEDRIENDLKAVDTAIREYWNF